MKYSNAIKSLRASLKALIETKKDCRRQIQALGPDPATGPQRSVLKTDYNVYTRPKVRAACLALGFLKGVPYLAMEPKCYEPPPAGLVLTTIQAALGDDEALRAEWTIDKIITLLDVPQQEAA
jgi:hypothetical protein